MYKTCNLQTTSKHQDFPQIVGPPNCGTRSYHTLSTRF